MKYIHRSTIILVITFLAAGLAPRLPGARAQVITLQVTAEQANVREKPDIMSPVVKQLVTGAVLEAERKVGEWYEVRVDLDAGGTVTGYVHESLVRVVAGAPAETRPAPRIVREPAPAEPKARPAAPAVRVAQEPKESAPAPKRNIGRRSLSLWYGGRYAAVGDLNEGAKGTAGYVGSLIGVQSQGDVSFVHAGSAFGGEYRHPLLPGLKAALGFGYFSAEKSSTAQFQGQPKTTYYLTTPKIRTYPINLSLVFYPFEWIYVKAGAEVDIAHCEYLYQFITTTTTRQWLGKANALGFGYVLGGGLEWKILGPFSVFGEANYRHVRIGSLDGEEVASETGKATGTTTGTLYFTESFVSGGSSVARVYIHPGLPGGSGIIESRKAVLSLSGVSLGFGLKIDF